MSEIYNIKIYTNECIEFTGIEVENWYDVLDEPMAYLSELGYTQDQIDKMTIIQELANIRK
jgi:mannitol/fructose-specific phosphotransferase system IIA component (Ntr-type)